MKTVVVLCLPRTGSSLLTGILHRLGIRMGSDKDLVRGKHANKYGAYENQDFYRLNIRVLALAGSPTLAWADIPDAEKVKRIFQKFEPKIQQIIHKHERELWGWKDPNNIYTLPYFEKYLVNPHYIVLKRDIESIVKSHLKLSKFANWNNVISYYLGYMNIKTIFYFAWYIFKYFISNINVFNNEDIYREVATKGYNKIEEFVKDKKHMEVLFNDLINNSTQVINQIVEFLDIDPSNQEYKNAKAFIDRDEVHFRKKPKKKFSRKKRK